MVMVIWKTKTKTVGGPTKFEQTISFGVVGVGVDSGVFVDVGDLKDENKERGWMVRALPVLWNNLQYSATC